MIRIGLTGRQGNQMFQLAYAYLLSRENLRRIIIKPASHFGYDLRMFHLPLMGSMFSEKIFLSIHRFLGLLLPWREKIVDKSCLNPVVINEVTNNVSVEGYFQDGSFYVSFRQSLHSLFKVKSKIEDIFQSKYAELLKSRILVMSVRLGNYKVAYFEEIKNHGLLPSDWYLRALEKADFSRYEKLVVLSDEIEEVKREFGLEKFDPIYIHAGPETDYMFLLNGNGLIISNSSFSWWGAFLNQKPELKVYAPRNWVGYHAGVEYPKGIMLPEWEWVA